jgi:hypothetical protein
VLLDEGLDPNDDPGDQLVERARRARHPDVAHQKGRHQDAPTEDSSLSSQAKTFATSFARLI